jgi:hemerythrin superfamily protein
MARAKSRSRTGAKSRSSSSRTTSRRTASRSASSRGSSRSATSRRTSSRGKSTTNRTSRQASPARNDAITLLKADHRQVEELFAQFEKARGDDRKQDLATRVCDALRVHSQIEEEIFYPAFYEATQEEDLHHEAIIEHDSVKKLIAEIESSSPADDYFDARVTVLSEMVKHHVKEEEQRDGILAKARSAGMDLEALGEQMAQRKSDLESSPEAMKALGRAKDAGKGVLSRLTSEI